MKHSTFKILSNLFFLSWLLFSFNLNANAQQVTVSSTGDLNFGSFSKINGGTITLFPDGTTNTTGDIILVNFGAVRSTATIELSTKANKGVLVTVSADPINLVGTAAGGILQLSMIFDRTSVILTKDVTEYIQMGGTLTVGPEDTRDYYFVADVPITFSYQ